jgi:hypothetical protein
VNERERLKATLRGTPPDKLPWYADLSYLYSSMEDRGTLEARFAGAAGYLRFHQEMGAGICFYAPFLWEQRYTHGVSERVQETSGTRITTVSTPVGSVREVQTYMPDSYTWAITEHYVKELPDLRVLLYACEHRDLQPAYEAYVAVDRSWGPHGLAVGIAPICSAPLQRMLTRWSGVSVLMDLYMDHSRELASVFTGLEEADTPIFDILCASPCDLIEFPENLSAEVVGRRFFERYNAPYYQRRTAALHAAGKKTAIHNDGTLRGTFDLLGPCGFDVIEAITPSPVGDIPLRQLRAEAGPGVVLWGGLPGAMFSPCFSEEQFESHLQEAVRVFTADGRCVLGVADQVPPDGLISRVKRVREVVEGGAV